MGNRFSAKVQTDTFGGQTSPLLKYLATHLPPNIVDKARGLLLFRPNDPNDLLQSFFTRMSLKDVPRIKGYRYPAPGSQSPVNIPVERDELSHSISYYARASKNFPAPKVVVRPARYADSPLSPGGKFAVKYVLPPGLLPDPAAPGDTSKYIVDPGLTSSPGNKNPAVMRYDPTGLSSTMTASWPEMYKSLAAHAVADHLPRPSWKGAKEDAVIAEYEKKGLPVPPGRQWLLDIDLPKLSKVPTW